MKIILNSAAILSLPSCCACQTPLPSLITVSPAIYHFLLFLIVSWTVYNTFIFSCLLLPASENEFANLELFDFWDFYLLGALDFSKFLRMLSDSASWLSPDAINRFWPFLLYVFVINGLAIYIWCSNQNIFSAWFLDLAPCVASPYLVLLFKDFMLLLYGFIGTVAFYGILSDVNDYRKKHWPWLTLPAWLEWRRPNMVPSIPTLARKIAHMIKKIAASEKGS